MRRAGGRAGAEAARLILFFPLLTLPTQVLLACLLCFACLHTLLTLGGGSSRNLELCGVQKIDFVFLTLMRIWEYNFFLISFLLLLLHKTDDARSCE